MHFFSLTMLFNKKRTHNATSMNAIQNNFICYTLSIASTPSKSSTPTRPRTSKSFLCMRHNYSGQYICHSMK